jgi:sigma-B regulation protein RsbU (phosphoserine phosphatase)
MDSVTDEVLALEVHCDEAAPGVVRAAFERLDWLGALVDDIKLVASELVTNAVLHSGCRDDQILAVRATRGPGQMTISVHDPGLSGQEAEPRRGGGHQRGGWGLALVAALSSRWGSERKDGYSVWAELALSR